MPVALLHLSDIHFGKNGFIIDKAERIAAAVRAIDPSPTFYVIVLSGDIAHSGAKSEYETATAFLSNIRSAEGVKRTV